MVTTASAPRTDWSVSPLGTSPEMSRPTSAMACTTAGSISSADVRAPFGPLVRTEVVVGHDVGDADASARAKHAMHLGEDPALVRRQVDHAVGDHHVDGVLRERDVLDVSPEEFDVGRPRLVAI